MEGQKNFAVGIEKIGEKQTYDDDYRTQKGD